jgi:hypothetical protein
MEKPNFFTKGTYDQYVPENDPQFGYLYGARRFKFLYDVQPGRCWNDDRLNKDVLNPWEFYGYGFCQ